MCAVGFFAADALAHDVFFDFIQRSRTTDQQEIDGADLRVILFMVRDAVQDVAHGVQARTFFAVGFDDDSRAFRRVGMEEHGFFGGGVVVPFVHRGFVHGT